VTNANGNRRGGFFFGTCAEGPPEEGDENDAEARNGEGEQA